MHAAGMGRLHGYLAGAGKSAGGSSSPSAASAAADEDAEIAPPGSMLERFVSEERALAVRRLVTHCVKGGAGARELRQAYELLARGGGACEVVGRASIERFWRAHDHECGACVRALWLAGGGGGGGGGSMRQCGVMQAWARCLPARLRACVGTGGFLRPAEFELLLTDILRRVKVHPLACPPPNGLVLLPPIPRSRAFFGSVGCLTGWSRYCCCCTG
eukprot:COSAG01_NODE_723_length_14060_cov_132.571807_9_plen_217_part_00